MNVQRFAYMVLLLMVLAQPGLGATFNVDSWWDLPDTNPGDGSCADSSGFCTLRAAVMESSASFASFDVIIIPPGDYEFSIAGTGEDAGATGDLDIGNVNIYGSNFGLNITRIDAEGIDRVFEVWDNVEISGVNIVGGSAPFGAGIMNHDVLSLLDVNVMANTAVGSGGGVRSQGASAVLNVSRSFIGYNISGAYGAGVSIASGSAGFVNSTISSNTAAGDSGGLDVDGAAAVTLTHTTITQNTADGDADGAGNGGGILIFDGTVTAVNNILGENLDTGGEAPDCGGTLNSNGYNLIQSVAGCVISGIATGNIYNQDPQIPNVPTYSGVTWLHPLYASSPARDTASAADCTPFDQRPEPRPFGAGCDMGAYEFNIGILFVDDFGDGLADDWTPLKGSWSVVAGALQGTTTRKADILSPFAGCGDPCSIEARVRIDSPEAHVSLLAFYQDKRNLMEVVLMEDKDKLLVKQRVNGTVRYKEKRLFPIETGVEYNVTVRLSGDLLAIVIDGSTMIQSFLSVSPSGTAGFRMKSTTGLPATATFDDLLVY